MAVRGLTIAAVLFDALGTLVELEPPAPRLRAELRQRFGLEVDQRQAERAIAAEIGYYRTHLLQGRDRASLAVLHARCAAVLAGELNRQLERPVPSGQDMVDALLASLTFDVFADVRGVLGELRSMGLRIVVVSNWDISLADVLERLGLTRWLDGVVASAAVGVGKPGSAVFERALKAAGVAPEQAIHVGDSPHEDVQGALAAGIQAVLIRRDGQVDTRMDEPLHQTIRSLRELPGLVSAQHG